MQIIQGILPSSKNIIKNGSTIFLLDSLADPQSNGIDIKFLSKGLKTE
jgi:hypothetical protein